jgi:hypothetical protein
VLFRYAIQDLGAKESEYPYNNGIHLSAIDTRMRITNTFCTSQSKPNVVFFNDTKTFWPLKLNEYGVTQYLGSKVCVMVGPRGQNPDVVAQFMHAEIAYRVGFWRRFMQVPIWFDEGLAHSG